jgi:type II secretory pathway pseudopilin PulG
MHGQSNGFTLLETVVAMGILVTVLAGIAHLFALSARQTTASAASGLGLVAAQAKLEMLRSLPLAYGPLGETITDPSLQASPPASLREDIDGYVEYLDESGEMVDEEADAAFTRRWAVTPIDHFEPRAVVIEVCVYRSPAQGRSPVGAEACLATIRSRQP